VLVFIQGTGEKRLPIIRLDGKDYFLLGGTYQRLHNEKIINERYAIDGEFDRQMKNTGKKRWKFTVLVPASISYLSYDILSDPSIAAFDFGDLATLHTSADKVYPYDGLYYYDIDRFENFTGTYSHYVYMKIDWETPNNNDPGQWQIPVELWGRDA
jgi:hypothetical protein